MIKELLYELYTDHRLFVGTGTVLVLYLLCALVFVMTQKEKDHDLPLLLCVPVTIGAALLKLFEACRSGERSRAMKIGTGVFAAALCILAVTMSGKNVFSPEISARAENEMHIPTDICAAEAAVLADGDCPIVLTMPGWDTYLRAYSSRPTVIREDEDPAFSELGKIHPDMGKVAKAAKKKDIAYVILSKGIWQDMPLDRFGYEIIYENDTCAVYREVSTP